MSMPHALDVLFLTNFSDYCFRSIPAVAQMADWLRVRLTILHAYNPGKCSQSDADAQVRSFFPEADRYPACHRYAVPGRLLDAVRRHLEVWPVNLIVAPASDPIGLPRIGDRSVRARIVEECGVPVWTMGRRTQFSRLLQPVKNVACWLDFYSRRMQHLAFAIEYAKKTGAQLHLLRALPEIHDGSIVSALDPETALHPRAAAEQIRKLCAGAPVAPEVHVSSGEGSGTLARMLRDCDADLVFLPEEETLWSRWLGVGLRAGNRNPCPAIYVGNTVSIPMWNLETGGAARPAMTAAHADSRRQPGLNGTRNGARAASWLAALGLM